MPYAWWHKDSTGRKRLVIKACDRCPCEGCEPKIIAHITAEPNQEVSLVQWQGDKIGYPGARWRLIETSDCYLYMYGEIDENGRLVGLPRGFTSDYSYQGRLQLQQGCPDEFGIVHWPSVSGCDNLNQSN